MTFEEIYRLASRLGIRKIRLTGGKPLLRKDIDVLISMLKNIQDLQDVSLTINGYF
mgnify:CR=1 FL=1